MATGSERPALSEREGFSMFTAGDAGVITIQRLATALAGRYQIERELGHGGAAFVFLATDLKDNKTVALKVLRPELVAAMGEARFNREVEIVRGLEHPNILPLLDSGSADGLVYFTMPFISGETLRTHIKKERQLTLDEAISITRQVAKALDYAHTKGLVHRDIKPANILLDNGRVIVADFGIARAMKVASGEEITTHSGFAIGTPEYMSPEQAVGQRELDGRCDIYALGCVTYEMLVGEPPFTGPTAQAIIARHCQEPPHSIRVIRATVPHGVERAIGKALAKVPADRYQNASDFVHDLEQGSVADETRLTARISHRNRVLLAVVAIAIAASGTWYGLHPRPPTLDRNRVVVFPLHDPQAPGNSDVEGEGAATYIGYALDGTRPLKWLDGWELLDATQRVGTKRLDPRQGNRVSSLAGAAFYIDGSIVRRPDSVTVILRLLDVSGDSVMRIAGKSGPVGASIPQLSLAAVGELLPPLVAPGGKIDLSEFTNRRPTAIANFLQGEREYRRMQFLSALGHYRLALGEDSAFTLAAVRGAYAANWESELDEGASLTQIALRHPESMSPAQALLAQGLHAYLVGAADSSIAFLNAALRRDSTIHAGWTLLGEVYSRLLPVEYRADSLARDALLRARKLDPDFAPTLLLLEERALRDGNVLEVLRLQSELKKAGADTTHAVSRDLMLRCIRSGPPSVDWDSELLRNEMTVLSSGKILSARAAQPQCAIAIFGAIVRADSVSLNTRWAAFLGLQSQYAALQAHDAAANAFRQKTVANLPLKVAYPLVAAASGDFEREAAHVADSVATAYNKASTPVLWTVGTWEAHRGNTARLREIAGVLEKRAAASGARSDLLLSKAMTARLTLVEGDSTRAVQMLRNLIPNATRAEIVWQPWESLGPERMALAEVLYARGELEDARRVATLLDATEPLTYPLYLRQSLMLRLRVAQAINNKRLIDEYQTRLRQLSWAGNS
ncbi:MAG TPA: serine/threonine-protein kinase [Gemmatimonadaceae bacterium]